MWRVRCIEVLSRFGVGALSALILLAAFKAADYFFGWGYPETEDLWILLPHLVIFGAVLEETVKFFLVRRWVQGIPQAVSLGFGYALIEVYFKLALIYVPLMGVQVLLNPKFWIVYSPIVLMHVFTVATLALFRRDGYPVLGLVLAITLHAAFNIYGTLRV